MTAFGDVFEELCVPGNNARGTFIETSLRGNRDLQVGLHLYSPAAATSARLDLQDENIMRYIFDVGAGKFSCTPCDRRIHLKANVG